MKPIVVILDMPIEEMQQMTPKKAFLLSKATLSSAYYRSSITTLGAQFFVSLVLLCTGCPIERVLLAVLSLALTQTLLRGLTSVADYHAAQRLEE
jgi:hypothetical protein